MTENDTRNDSDPQETQEWLDALDSVLEAGGPERAQYLLERLFDEGRRGGVLDVPFSPNTSYLNTIPRHREEKSPGDHAIEWRLRSMIRWNALAMVVHTNRENEGLGGHIASFQSAATLYDVGFNHFFHAAGKTKDGEDHGGDLVFIQGHCAPGIYARAFMEGRLTEEQMLRFRQEALEPGLSSYPHPWLMPDFWSLPTVSMGLGPLMAIYQARFMRYLQHRDIADTAPRKVWCYCGDGEMDEPESLGSIDLAGQEKLDNLIFVINCNLQRLDGPVHGNGKIIQDLEGVFRGAGWNVIKVIWGSAWDPLIAADKDGILRKRMEEVIDGDYQNFKSKDGAYVREHFFGASPELLEMVSNMSDDDIWRLNRGGHDPHKVYAAYHEAVHHKGQPTVILAKTVKGYGMGEAGEGKNITHQQKKMGDEALKEFRDRFDIPVSDDDIHETPFYKPDEDSPEIKYLKERREALGGYMPKRSPVDTKLEVPPLETFDKLLDGTGDREISTTMAFVQILSALLRDKKIGKHVVPIVPDEARTFGMEGLFRQYAIYSSVGQLYTPQDADQMLFYKEDKQGQILEEGINEAGAMSSWIAAATAYANHGVPMIPFYIYYSMFGFQRVGDLCWAAGDMRARGFLLGGTAGRTTLNGEGLQHEDGHSHLLASTIPNCISYDPTYAYEVAVIIHDGMRRMYQNNEDVYYYLTLMNENYQHQKMPDGVEDGIKRGIYLLRSTTADGPTVQLMGSGTILREVEAAAQLLHDDWGIGSDIWSATSMNELARDGHAAERWNMLNPAEQPKRAYVSECLDGHAGPVVCSTDYQRSYSEQIRPFIDRRYIALGTDGFGRSDSREALRSFFEVDRHYVVLAALNALARDGAIDKSKAAEAITKYNIDATRPAPWTV